MLKCGSVLKKSIDPVFFEGVPQLLEHCEDIPEALKKRRVDLILDHASVAKVQNLNSVDTLKNP
jgi:hypothetical protein